MSRIFLSHSSVDELEAVALQRWMAKNGWEDVFLDIDAQRGLVAGERWQEALRQAADRCEAVVFIVTPAWAKSKWCLAEFLLAKSLNKRIFGAILKPVEIGELPTELTAEWHLCYLVGDGPQLPLAFNLRGQAHQIEFLAEGLDRLRIGLEKAGLNARYVPTSPLEALKLAAEQAAQLDVEVKTETETASAARVPKRLQILTAAWGSMLVILVAIGLGEWANRLATDRPANDVSPHLQKLAKRTSFWGITTLLLLAVAFTGNFVPEEWVGIPAIAVLLFFPAWFIYWKLSIKLGLENRRVDATRVTPTDQAPVLYLRSFDDDAAAARLKGGLTEEEHLAQLLSHIGPFVAIGRPGESLPHVGAQRIYVDDCNWQNTVESLMRTARLVVIRTGRTDGLQWELQKALAFLKPEQLLLVVDDKREMLGFLEDIGKTHPHVGKRIRVGGRSVGSIRGFVIFNQDWQPSFLRPRGYTCLFYQHQNESFAGPKLARALRPIFERIGVVWPKPAIDLLKTILIAVLFALPILAFFVTDHDVVSVAFSPDGRRIVSGSLDNTLQLWDTNTGQPIGTPLQGHENRVGSVAFSPDGRLIVSGSGDNTLRLWDANTGKPIGAPLQWNKSELGDQTK